ncbi:IPT/TIG domain-containing protein [Pseudochryseolinea flava]|nr:IPT/TIG domain-containing protein [Pseudochryseolinea flava]
MSTLFLVFACEEDEPGGGPVPTITSMAPLEGLVGDEVTIKGTDLNEVISVYFGGVKTKPSSKTKDELKVLVPPGGASGEVKLTYEMGHIITEQDFTVTFRQVVISRFTEANLEEAWPKSEDTGEITVSEFPTEAGNTFFRLKGGDTNKNHWLGGRYHGTGNPETPLGVEETDAAKVFFNVKVKSNVDVNPEAYPKAKLVFYVYDAEADSKKKNWEIDFPVTSTNWSVISIAAADFHRWNGSGFSDFSGDIESVSEIALYLTGGSDAVYDISFDDVIFSEGTALGTILKP